MVISLASILETFIDSVCGLAIESNLGVLINASKSLDGVSLLKTKRLEREVIENAIEDIAFSHPAPQTALEPLRSENVSTLQKRNL